MLDAYAPQDASICCRYIEDSRLLSPVKDTWHTTLLLLFLLLCRRLSLCRTSDSLGSVLALLTCSHELISMFFIRETSCCLCHVQIVLTLLSRCLFNLRCRPISYKSIMRLEFLQRLVTIVNECEPGRLAPTILSSESET